MVRRFGKSSLLVVILAVLLSISNSAEPEQQRDPEIQRLVEIKTIDSKGVVKARVVAEYKPTDSKKQSTSFPDAKDENEYVGDDEDSRDSSSGDSARSYGETYDMDIANDEPMDPSANQTSSESSGLPSQSSITSDNSTSKSVTTPVNSNTSSTAVPTMGQSNNASTLSPTTSRTIIPTTSADTTAQNTVVPQTTKPATTGATVTTAKDNATSLSSLSPVTLSTKDVQNITTLPPKVTEVKTDLKTTTTVAATTETPKPTEITRTPIGTTHSVVDLSTARPNITDHEITGNKTNTTVSTKQVSTTSPTTPNGSGVRVQTDPEIKAKRQKTLFGFVTVEILIALLAGALFSVLLVAFLVYRLKKRNEGSYELSETIALRPKEIDEMGKKKEVFV